MELSLFLAEVIGIYFIVMGLVLLIRREEVRKIAARIVGDRPLSFVAGTITLILGLLLVLSHNVWVSGWEVVVTIVGWIVLLKGLLLLLLPEKTFDSIVRDTNKPPLYLIGGIVMLAVGLFLVAKGFGY